MEHDKKLEIASKMREYGGSFAKALSEAWLLADSGNAEKIEKVFGGLIKRYENELDK